MRWGFRVGGEGLAGVDLRVRIWDEGGSLRQSRGD
jgi:hypothetical protein